METFREESLENLAAIEDGLMRIEARPGDQEALGAVFRAAHTIKRSAASLGFQSLKELAHLFEDVLARLRDHTLAPSTELMSVLLGAVDLLRREIAQAVGPTSTSCGWCWRCRRPAPAPRSPGWTSRPRSWR